MTSSALPSWTEGALFGLAGLAGLAWSIQFTPRPVLVNESLSVPRGLYLRSPGAKAERGAIVAVRPPAIGQTYLAQLGAPPKAKLLKRVAAVAGEPVCAGPGQLTLRGRRVVVIGHDRRGRPLPAWRACRRLAPGELFLLGDAATSFDSRYFGPVGEGELEGVYRAVLTW